MRLVDADKEIEFYKRILYNPTPDVSESDRWHTHAIVNAFERAKTVESRPKGKWIETKRSVMGEGFMWECSECGNEVYVSSKGDFPKYCDECGAEMRGEE